MVHAAVTLSLAPCLSKLTWQHLLLNLCWPGMRRPIASVSLAPTHVDSEATRPAKSRLDLSHQDRLALDHAYINLRLPNPGHRASVNAMAKLSQKIKDLFRRRDQTPAGFQQSKIAPQMALRSAPLSAQQPRTSNATQLLKASMHQTSHTTTRSSPMPSVPERAFERSRERARRSAFDMFGIGPPKSD